ncbi:mechanosensitive ion channel family protein [Oenococcus alcoholitolerans]|uniref:mechanosensitive ion channel family protein n=1 Tax=Oenococcus alcoholitolerans TaxID=931074 RepID=UPI003F6F862C
MLFETIANNWINYWENFDWTKIGSLIINNVIQILIFSLIFWLINRIAVFLVDRSFLTYSKSKRINKKRAATLHTLLKNTARYIVVFFYLYTILSILDFPIGTLIASAGIVTIVIGLGAQSIIKDIISGFLILLEQQMEVGDTVTINNNVNGKLVAFGLRITTIKSADGSLNYIANSSITTIKNQSRNSSKIQIDLPVGQTEYFDQIIKKISQITKQEAKTNKNILDQGQIKAPTVLSENNILGISVLLTVKNSQSDKIKSELTSKYLSEIIKIYKEKTDQS